MSCDQGIVSPVNINFVSSSEKKCMKIFFFKIKYCIILGLELTVVYPACSGYNLVVLIHNKNNDVEWEDYKKNKRNLSMLTFCLRPSISKNDSLSFL